jgi:hypothetical protein
MSLLWKRQNIGIKTETTEGSAIAMQATDFLLVEGLSWKPNIEMLDRNYRRATLDPLSKIAGKASGEVTFSVPFKTSGTAGTADTPRGALLMACGLSQVASAGVSVTYAPISAKPTGFSSPAKTVTACFQVDGLQYRLTGCVGNVKFKMKAGMIVMLDISLKGKYEVPSDVALTAPTYSAAAEQIFQSSSFSFDSVSTFVIDTLEIDFGNEVVEKPSSLATTGLGGFLLTGRAPVGSMDPELVLVATYNFLAKQVTATPAALSFVVGAGAGNINTITIPKAQITGVDFGERNGIAIANCKLAFSQTTGDDWISIVQT